MTRKLPRLLLNIILNNRDNNEQIFLSFLEEYFVDPCKKRISISYLAQANFRPFIAQIDTH
jgi:hypothetical protein